MFKSNSIPVRILILSDPQDYHSLAVSEILKHKKVEHDIWYLSDFPILQTASTWIDSETDRWEIEGPDLRISQGTTPSAIWMRRPGQPTLPPEIVPADSAFAYRECRAFLNGLQQQVGAGTFWVNPPASFPRTSSKLEQLRAAVRCGFSIPRTLMSNDPRRIREILEAQPDKVIYKSFFPAFWDTSDGVAAVFSTPLLAEDLPNDEILKATPGIFQVLVPKLCELRITVIGQHIFAARIDSQSVPSARFDWRAARERVPIEPFALPQDVAGACHRLMADLGLVFGCFDLIVTPDHDYVFLEVNEMGAFLWLEEQNPEIRLLAPFCELLLQGRPDFKWSPETAELNLEDVRIAALQSVHEANTAKRHVLRPPLTVQDHPG